ncbi:MULTISPECIES: hypothetical protein [Mycolicibacter]|uniref:Transmembrane protein n=1 Tax=Mycolicibacter virginiensis TaxID=1795032 RepID=A0A9X7NY12_9MYCO|nr:MULTISPECIES: hypothetical protein [Mycobacteriaceae]OBG39471.1 hypothetical protein A5671_16320 [Mycolicibacter heraklionensis]PQM51592.1 hypothetical protein C5U48_14110 [Mycolicibacter virginiensis]ULP47913.1 hypothetical protein MJO54_01710 [Mycolicibacter virginiensis]
MARNRYAAKPPLYGMALVFCAIAIVAVTAYLHAGWWSMVGYALAAVAAVAGTALAFRDLS